MDKATLMFLTLTLLTAAGCGGGGKTDSGGDGERPAKLSLKVSPDAIELKPGGEQKVTLTVTRENFDKDVELVVRNTGGQKLEVADKTRQIPKGIKKAEFTIKAGADAPPVENYEFKIGVKYKDLRDEKTVKVTVKRDPAAERAKFVDEAKGKLTVLKDKVMALPAAKEIKASLQVQGEYAMDIGKLLLKVAEAETALKGVEGADAAAWEGRRGDANASLQAVQEALDALQKKYEKEMKPAG